MIGMTILTSDAGAVRDAINAAITDGRLFFDITTDSYVNRDPHGWGYDTVSYGAERQLEQLVADGELLLMPTRGGRRLVQLADRHACERGPLCEYWHDDRLLESEPTDAGCGHDSCGRAVMLPCPQCFFDAIRTDQE